MPFVNIDIHSIVKYGKATPPYEFELENLKIHTECPGYGKGKRIYANKNIQRKLDRLAYAFAIRFKDSFEKG